MRVTLKFWKMRIQNIEDRITEQKFEKIKSLISEKRLNRFEQVLGMRTRKLVLCLENIYHPHNASATIRTAEAFGIQEINVVEETCSFSPSVDIVRGTDKWIELNRWDSTQELVEKLRLRGYSIVATSPRPGSATIENFNIGQKPIALFMGTEKTGISDFIEQNADEMLYIPMCGLAESLNISVSAAIIMQRLAEKIRQRPENEWKLSDDECRDLLVNWIANTVRNGHDVVEMILG